VAQTVVGSIQVRVAPQELWQILCDPHRYPEIADPTDRMIDVPDEEMGVGYVYKEYGGIKPFIGESEWRVTEFDPVKRQVHVGDDGSVTMDLVIELTPSEGGTRLTQSLTMTPRWYIAPLNAILWPLFMHRRAQESMDKTVENFKRVAESSD